jgi:hypothetical protein
LSALLGLVAVAGCSSSTQPEDIATAAELCAKRGGFSSVARYEHGKTLTINCADGLHLEVRLHEVKK